MKRLRDFFRRITGISTPVGGVSWSLPETRIGKVPIFREPIYITSPYNDEFISFLETNTGGIVFLDTHIDASVTFMEQFEIVNKEGLDLDTITSGKFSGVILPLPNKKGLLLKLTFYFTESHVLKYSSGGTGLITVDVKGFFEISRTLHGGPSTVFHLKEIEASLEDRVAILNRD